MNAYLVTCTGVEKNPDGSIKEIHCTYDPETRGGNAPDGRKVKGTIHWVSANHNYKGIVRLYENLIDEEKGVYNEEGEINFNPDSLKVCEAVIEEGVKSAKAFESFQFVRNGFYTVDYKDSAENEPVFNRIVSLKSSFKLPKK